MEFAHEFSYKLLMGVLVICLCIWTGSTIYRNYQIGQIDDWYSLKPTFVLDDEVVDVSELDLYYYGWHYDKDNNVVKLYDRGIERDHTPIVINISD